MRWSDIVSGIILILSISDFTLAAPLLGREKLHACVDVVHTGIHKDMPVMGKRGKEDIDKLAKIASDYFEKWGKPDWWPEAHDSSSSAPPGPDQGSTVDVKAPEPNPASPPANPHPVLESSIPSPKAHLMPGVEEDELNESDYEWLFASDSENELHAIASQTSTKFDLDHALTGEHVAQPKPNPGPSAGADPDFDWEYWMKLANPPRKRPVSPKEFGQASGQQPEIGPSTDPDFDWNYWTNLKDEPPPKRLKLASLEEFGQAHAQQSPSIDSVLENSVGLDDLPPPLKDSEANPRPMEPGTSNPRPLDPGTSNPGPADSGMSPEEPEEPEEPEHEVNKGPPASPELTDPEVHSNHQSLSMEDFMAAIYGAKGKVKELRGIRGTARDVGNMGQKELHPV
jgi:hypothetical protein